MAWSNLPSASRPPALPGTPPLNTPLLWAAGSLLLTLGLTVSGGIALVRAVAGLLR